MTRRVADLEQDVPDRVNIAGLSIDACEPPLVIAEIGVNHDGCVERAIALADVAREAGADAVKIQVFRADVLVQADAGAAAYQQARGAARTQRELLAALELAEVDVARIAGHCRDRGILLLATPFSPEAVDLLFGLGVPAIKIASTDLDNLPLLETAARTGLPLLLSTGASTLNEIDEAFDRLDQLGAAQRLVLMHCVSSYPTAPEHAALASIPALSARYRRWVGFSDHTREVESAGLAVACGAKVLEKHLTLDRGAEGPDHAMSLTPQELRSYVDCARRAWRMVGRPRTGVLPVEEDVRRVARRSVVARVDIAAGELFTSSNLTLKRPAGGLPPAAWTGLLGRRAVQDIPADTPLVWSMVN